MWPPFRDANAVRPLLVGLPVAAGPWRRWERQQHQVRSGKGDAPPHCQRRRMPLPTATVGAARNLQLFARMQSIWWTWRGGGVPAPLSASLRVPGDAALFARGRWILAAWVLFRRLPRTGRTGTGLEWHRGSAMVVVRGRGGREVLREREQGKVRLGSSRLRGRPPIFDASRGRRWLACASVPPGAAFPSSAFTGPGTSPPSRPRHSCLSSTSPLLSLPPFPHPLPLTARPPAAVREENGGWRHTADTFHP